MVLPFHSHRLSFFFLNCYVILHGREKTNIILPYVKTGASVFGMEIYWNYKYAHFMLNRCRKETKKKKNNNICIYIMSAPIYVLCIIKLLIWLSLQSFQLHRVKSTNEKNFFEGKSTHTHLLYIYGVFFFLRYIFVQLLPIPYLIPIYDYLYVLKLTRNFLKIAMSLTHTRYSFKTLLLLVSLSVVFCALVSSFSSYFHCILCYNMYINSTHIFALIKSILCNSNRD